jgi:hypothetical protein
MNAKQATKNTKKVMRQLNLKKAEPGDMSSKAKKMLGKNSKKVVGMKGLI